MLEIAKMLVLSTAHVDEDTALRLTKGMLPTDFCTTYFAKGGYGWFMHVSEEIADREANPQSLANCLDFAVRHGCQWIMFDRDGDTVDELTTYDW
jgi:hypothetical protein